MGRTRKNEILTKEEELALGKIIYEWKEDRENKEKHQKAIEAAQKLFLAIKDLHLKRLMILFVEHKQEIMI